jgi:hypothetical protein
MIERSFSAGPWAVDGISIVRDRNGERLCGLFDAFNNVHLIAQVPDLYRASVEVVLYLADRLEREIIPPIELLYPVAVLSLAILKAQSWELGAKREIELFDGVQFGPFAKTPATRIIIRTAALIREARKEKAGK